jgi:hypothetical protein
MDLTKPAIPLDASKCPIFALIEPTNRSVLREVSQKTSAIDEISILSPRISSELLLKIYEENSTSLCPCAMCLYIMCVLRAKVRSFI